MLDPPHAIRMMRALRDAGMRIAIDDFGTGYSSLAYLNRFPVSSLKIDRSFVKDMAKNKDDATIVRTIIEMAHSRASPWSRKASKPRSRRPSCGCCAASRHRAIFSPSRCREEFVKLLSRS